MKNRPSRRNCLIPTYFFSVVRALHELMKYLRDKMLISIHNNSIYGNSVIITKKKKSFYYPSLPINLDSKQN